MKRTAVNLFAVAGVGMMLGGVAGASEPEIPSIAGGASLAAELRSVRVSCEPLPNANGRRRIRCDVNGSSFSAPDMARAEGEIAGMASQLAEIFPKWCADLMKDPRLGEDEDNELMKSFYVEARQACVAKDSARFLQAFTRVQREGNEHTCSVGMPWKSSYDFTQVDANTWVAQPPPSEGDCSAATVATLWHSPGESGLLWNLKLLHATPPTASSTCPNKPGTTIVYDYRWRYHRVRDLGCRFVAF
jgi:hypothetical protein